MNNACFGLKHGQNKISQYVSLCYRGRRARAFNLIKFYVISLVMSLADIYEMAGHVSSHLEHISWCNVFSSLQRPGHIENGLLGK